MKTMKTTLIRFVITLVMLAPFAPAHATDDISETPEIQYSSASAIDLKTKADELASPVNIYEYLRNNAEYALYHGSRSGSINSYLGLRGNDVDLASTLIAMLRSRGIHARYVVGTVQVTAAQVMNWLGVTNLDLVVSIMQDQGIQNVSLSTDRSSVSFEHVWVEANVPYGDYRGGGQDAASVTCGTNSNCHWISLDPSFKQKQYNQAIDIYNNLSFDYTNYYDAIKNNDATRMNKNPLEIYEEQILTYLQADNPGKTLADVAYTGDIISQDNLILPASLPYTVTNTPRRYNSVADHDAVVPATEPKKWKKTLSVTFYLKGTTSDGGSVILNLGMGPVLLADLSTKRLTLTTEINGGIPNVVLRLDGVEIARPISGSGSIGGYTPAIGNPFSLTVSMDGIPASTSSGTDEIISATYSGIIGGYYLLATGGETSNWTQVHRAAQQLLTKNQQNKIVLNPAENGTNTCPSTGTCICDTITGINCTPYVDTSSNGWDASDPKLLDNKPAMDDLTGGLLQVAAMQYFTKMREGMARIDNLNHIKSPIAGFLGVVSSTHEVEYVDSTAFSVLPGGLLIDMKGITLSGSWRIDQPASYSNSQFELMGHITSSLEHEIWQELTGYDAVSTVRGIQMALGNGASLLNPKKNATTDTLPGLYASFGFNSAAPSPFQLRERTIYSTKPASWSHPSPASPATAYFEVLKKAPSGTTDPRRGILTYANDYYDSNLSYIATHLSQYTVQFYNNYFGVGTGGYFDYLNENQGFVPTQFVYRAYPTANTMYSTGFIGTMRNDLYMRDINQYWIEYLLPSTQTTGSTYRFMVDIRKAHEASSSNIVSLGFEIQNTSLSAGGGYVDATKPLKAAQAIVGTSVIAPTFNNAVFTDQNTISQTNNDVIKTPSTADPVSTVTGNNYHDETDFTIKGRGMDIAFTRTYNSAPSSTKIDVPLGYGWTHSYNMQLKSNDYGSCPNCAVGTGAGQRPENGNNKTSSITYTDERGGQHNYLVNESTYAVTPPTGEFDTLTLDSPSAGYHTLTFRNGVKYVFQGTNLKTAPNNTAKLTQIADPYGNQLNFTYTGSNLTAITDNLGISGRTGLTLTYTGNRLKDITDWTGRKWSYTYDASGNLASVTNPLTKTINYTYQTGTHNLYEVILPEVRDGKPVKTAFAYYQNGKTFNYANSLGYTETMDYDLYRKITRVTDPRGFIRDYEYDQNGLMTKLTEPDNGILRFDNTADLLRYKKTDAQNYTTTYSYRTDFASTGASNTGGNVTQETDPLTNTLQYTYGVYDQITHSKDKNGNGRTMAYNAAGKLQSVTLDSLNGTANVLLQSFTYNADGTVKQMVEYIDPANSARKRITDYAYQDNNLNLQSVTVSGSGQTVVTTFTYDTLGRKKTATVARRKSASDPTLVNLTTSYDYDVLDRVIKITDPLGNIAETLYDGNGKVTQVNAFYKKPDATLESRLIVQRSYDAADRMISEKDIYNAVTQYAYDEAGNLVQITDPNNHITEYEYDAMNRRTAVIDGNGFRTETVYDLAGHPVQSINPNGKSVQTSYDALGRPITLTDALGYQTTFIYDAGGNVTKMTDANANAGLQPKNSYGCTLYKVYDALNRVKQEVDALGGITSYTYDLLGNIISIIDAENHVTTFDYDDLGRLVTVRDPLVETPTDKVTAFTYDQAGNVLTKTKRSGAVTTYTYDNLNRLTRAQYTAPGATTITETFVYSLYGTKQSAANGDVTYTYGYDLKNRPLSKTDSRSGVALNYTYDPAGNVATRTNYDNTTTEYHYDSANRLVAERNRDFLEVSYHYDPAGRLLDRILSNGAKTNYIYDDGNRLLQLINTSGKGTMVSDTTYVRDRLGNITSQTDASGTTAFTYDALYRLINADYPGTVNDQGYTYDKVGNRKTMTKNGATVAYAHDVDNRMKEIHQNTTGGALLNSYVYDDDGNLATKNNGAGSVLQSLAYDAKGRAKTITTSGVGTVTALTYDPYDYRIAKTDSIGGRTYLLEGEHLEGVTSGTVGKAMYLRGAVIDEIVNAFLYESSGDVNYTFHHDALQSVLGLSGHDGTVLQTIAYGPFGEKIAITGNANSNRLHYTGREEDPDTGLYYYRARLYDPGVGRFITEDPKGFGAGVNFYAYCGNNPVNYNDPMGMERGDWNDIRSYTDPLLWSTVHQDVMNGAAGQRAIDTAKAEIGIFAGSAQLAYAALTKGLFSKSVGVHGLGNYLGSIGELSNIIYGGDRDYNFTRQGYEQVSKALTGEEAYGTVGFYAVDFGLGLKMAFEPVKQASVVQTTFGVELERYRSLPSILTNGSSVLLHDTVQLVNSGKTLIDSFDTIGGASGGFVLYPNKSNTNMMRQVYQK